MNWEIPGFEYIENICYKLSNTNATFDKTMSECDKNRHYLSTLD